MGRIDLTTNEVDQALLHTQTRARRRSLFTIFGLFIVAVVTCKVVGGALGETYVIYLLAAVAMVVFVIDMRRLTHRFKSALDSADDVDK